jgi:hypothetical protein
MRAVSDLADGLRYQLAVRICDTVEGCIVITTVYFTSPMSRVLRSHLKQRRGMRRSWTPLRADSRLLPGIYLLKTDSDRVLVFPWDVGWSYVSHIASHSPSTLWAILYLVP